MDATSGIAQTEYRVDGGAWERYAGASRITTGGTHVVEYRSTDAAGLQEAVRSVSFQIDTNLLSPSGPVGPSLLVFLVAIVVAFSILAFLLSRKRRKELAEPPLGNQGKE